MCGWLIAAVVLISTTKRSAPSTAEAGRIHTVSAPPYRPSACGLCVRPRRSRATGLRAPATAGLSLARFRAKLASSIRREQSTWIEPMVRPGARQDRRQGARELRIVRTPMMPQRLNRWTFRETQDLFHTTIAVRRDNKHRAGQRDGRSRKRQHQVVMELALLGVLEQLMAAAGTIHGREECAESQIRREALNRLHRAPYAVRSVLVSALHRHCLRRACGVDSTTHRHWRHSGWHMQLLVGTRLSATCSVRATADPFTGAANAEGRGPYSPHPD